MTNRYLATAALLICLPWPTTANAQAEAFRDPFVSVAKGARAAPNKTAALPSPAPERFGPVVVTPAPADTLTIEAKPTFSVQEQSAKPAPVSCTITSKLSGKDAKALIAKIATEEEFDLNLLNAVAKQESDFRMDQISPAGAMGLMQLMPATAKSLGVDPCDPEQNIRGSIKLLRLLDTKYGGNIIYILAAYNAGEDAVDRNGGIPPYRETITYVTRILSNLNGWEIPRSGKSSSKPIEQNVTDNEQPKPAANRWAQGFVLHVE